MSSYAYCANCDFGLPAPTTREVIADDWCCHHCGTQQYLEPEKQQEALLEILDRLEDLEDKLRRQAKERHQPNHIVCKMCNGLGHFPKLERAIARRQAEGDN